MQTKQGGEQMAQMDMHGYLQIRIQAYFHLGKQGQDRWQEKI